MVFVGFHDGNIMNVKFNPGNPEENEVIFFWFKACKLISNFEKIKSEVLLTESILFLFSINNDIIMVSSTGIKIVNGKNTIKKLYLLF